MNLFTLFAAASLWAAEPSAKAIDVPSAVLKLAEEVDVPASEAGVLAKLLIKEGQVVREGDLLAQIVDNDARLAVERARLEIAAAARKASSNVNIEFARKSLDVSKAELQRSLNTNAAYPKTVSQSDLDRLRLLVERGELEIKQAELERDLAKLTLEVQQNEMEKSQETLARRSILAPLPGMVVEIHRRRGEWVQPGDAVARIVRTDRLRAEGFLDARRATLDLVGSKVRLKVGDGQGPTHEFEGTIEFVSPEVDPLNSQVRIWADVRNENLKLRPGMQAAMIIEPRAAEPR